MLVALGLRGSFWSTAAGTTSTEVVGSFFTFLNLTKVGYAVTPSGVQKPFFDIRQLHHLSINHSSATHMQSWTDAC